MRKSRCPIRKCLAPTSQICQKARRLDLTLAQDGGDVGIGAVQQADQEMLDLDIVVGAQRCDSGCRFESATADVVQTSDQRLQLYRAHVSLVASEDVVPDGRGAWP